MPLSAKLDGDVIFSYEYNKESWFKLKDVYKNKKMGMCCCETKAIPKISKLGNFFFAHASKSECPYKSESAEHIYLKSLIAKTAIKHNWSAYTEKSGETPQGEQWRADVLCTKNSSKLAFEVQWSPQTIAEFQRRQKKYKSSGISCVWLYRLQGNKTYFKDDIPHEYETPVFGMKNKTQSKNLIIPQFDVSIEDFISGIFSGKLKWIPRTGEKLIAKIIPHTETCWRCKKNTTIILGVRIYTENGIDLGFKSFDEDRIPEFILENTKNVSLEQNGIGKLKPRHSKTAGGTYLSNGCYHCDSLMGNYFLGTPICEYSNNKNFPESIGQFSFHSDHQDLKLEGSWYYNEKTARGFY